MIFSVYHEKEKTWEKELRKIKAIYDNRLKASQQRALKMEQMLTMQTYQVRSSDHHADLPGRQALSTRRGYLRCLARSLEG